MVHCSAGHIRALGRVHSNPYGSSRPIELDDPTWDPAKGIRVDVEYYELESPISVKQVGSEIRQLNIPYGPVDKNANPKQGYLQRFTLEGFGLLNQASGSPWPDWAELLVTQSTIS